MAASLYKTPQSRCSLWPETVQRSIGGCQSAAADPHARGRGKVRDFLQGNRRAKLIDWLNAISWIDSGLYTTWIGFRDWWAGYSSFFGRFEVKGVVRALERLTLEDDLERGRSGARHLRALPAFEGKMNLSDEYSVTFLDRYGNEIGKRGLLRDELGAARRNSRRDDQGDARHRGSTLLRAFRRGRHGHVPRPGRQCAA